MIERLSPQKKASWTVASDTAVWVVETDYPFYRHSPVGSSHEGRARHRENSLFDPRSQRQIADH